MGPSRAGSPDRGSRYGQGVTAPLPDGDRSPTAARHPVAVGAWQATHGVRRRFGPWLDACGRGAPLGTIGPLAPPTRDHLARAGEGTRPPPRTEAPPPGGSSPRRASSTAPPLSNSRRPRPAGRGTVESCCSPSTRVPSTPRSRWTKASRTSTARCRPQRWSRSGPRPPGPPAGRGGDWSRRMPLPCGTAMPPGANANAVGGYRRPPAAASTGKGVGRRPRRPGR